MKRIIFPLAVLAGGLLAAPQTASAQDFPLSQKIIVANELIHPVRVGAGQYTAEERADKFREILPRVIAQEPLSPSNIYIRRVDGMPAIYAGRFKLMTVTMADARVNNTTPERLARIWLRNYQRVLPLARPDMNWGANAR